MQGQDGVGSERQSDLVGVNTRQDITVTGDLTLRPGFRLSLTHQGFEAISRNGYTLNAIGCLGRLDDGDLAQGLQQLRSLVLVQLLPSLKAAQRGHHTGYGNVNRFEQAFAAK